MTLASAKRCSCEPSAVGGIEQFLQSLTPLGFRTRPFRKGFCRMPSRLGLRFSNFATDRSATLGGLAGRTLRLW